VSEPRVRPAEDCDLAAIQCIYADAVRSTASSFELEPPTIDEMRERRTRLVEAGYPYFVAELDGRLAGYCYAGPFRDRPAYRATIEDSVYVDRRFQRGGIGRILLERLIGACASLGFRQMIAVIGGNDNAASVRLHRRAGFERVGVLRDVGWKFECWQPVCIMQRSLGVDGGDSIRRD